MCFERLFLEQFSIGFASLCFVIGPHAYLSTNRVGFPALSMVFLVLLWGLIGSTRQFPFLLIRLYNWLVLFLRHLIEKHSKETRFPGKFPEYSLWSSLGGTFFPVSCFCQRFNFLKVSCYPRSQVEADHDEDEQPSTSKRGRRKPAYAGGLVLEPKKGI